MRGIDVKELKLIVSTCDAEISYLRFIRRSCESRRHVASCALEIDRTIRAKYE